MTQRQIFSALTSLTILVALCATSFARELSLRQVIQLANNHAFALASAAANVRGSAASKSAVESERLGSITLTSTSTYISEVSTLSLSIPGLPTLSRELGSHENFQNDIRYTLPLWTGGRLGSSIAVASAGESIASSLASSDTLRMYYQSHLEYFNLAATTESVRLAEVALARVRNLQNEVSDLHNAGLADSLALIEASISVNRASLQLSQATDAKRRAEIRLSQLCGLPVNDTIHLTDSLLPIIESMSVDSANMRPELLAAKGRIGLADARIRQQKSEWMPSVGAFAGYSYGKPNLDRFGNSWNDYWSAGAQLTWTFSPGGKTSFAVRKSKEEREGAVLEYNRLSEQIKTEELVARERLQTAATSYRISQQRALLRFDALRLSQVQFREGILSATRLFDAEQQLSEAELSAALSLVDWYAARSGYWYALGSSRLVQGL